MKKILFLLVFLIPFCGFADDKNTIVGKWREASRKNPKDQPVAYADTIFLEFLTTGEYIWQKKGGFIYRNPYKHEGNTIDIGMRYFTIVSQTNNSLVLKDEAGIYEFTSYTPPIYAQQSRKQEVYAPVNNIQQMAGHWSVYKRTGIKPGAVDYTRQLKWVDFYASAQNGKWGLFCAQRDADNTPSWYVDSYSNQTVYLKGKDARQFKVLKCEGGELIMEENGVTYYFKQFK